MGCAFPLINCSFH